MIERINKEGETIPAEELEQIREKLSSFVKGEAERWEKGQSTSAHLIKVDSEGKITSRVDPNQVSDWVLRLLGELDALLSQFVGEDWYFNPRVRDIISQKETEELKEKLKELKEISNRLAGKRGSDIDNQVLAMMRNKLSFMGLIELELQKRPPTPDA